MVLLVVAELEAEVVAVVVVMAVVVVLVAMVVEVWGSVWIGGWKVSTEYLNSIRQCQAMRERKGKEPQVFERGQRAVTTAEHSDNLISSETAAQMGSILTK